MLKSTTNADCPYFVIQGYLSSLELNRRAALAVIIKVIKELVCRHDFSPSLCRFGLGLSMKNKKSAILLCPNGTTNSDWPYFCYSENMFLLLGFHKSRAAHSKVIIINLVHKHGYSSFVNFILHIILPNLNFVNRFNKNYNAKMAVCFLEATPCKDINRFAAFVVD